MLNKICRAHQVKRLARGFAALNESTVNASNVSPSDVHESSVRGVGALLADLSKNEQNCSNADAICDEVEEFFRKRFRKVSFEDAAAVMSQLHHNKIEALDDKFWVWETLEEATRPEVERLSKDEIENFFHSWRVQQKGSEELFDLTLGMMFTHFAPSPFASQPKNEGHGHH